MQRVLRDLEHNQPTDESLRDKRVEIIQKHFPPSVADVYALPRLGADGGMEWWTRQQGLVRPFFGLSGDEKQALLQAYDRHQEQLGNLIGALESRGMDEQAGQLRTLQRPADVQNLYSVEGRLLVVRWLQAPAPRPSVQATPVVVPLPPSRKRVWPWLLALLLLLLLLLAAWWYFLRPQPALPAAPEASEVEAETIAKDDGEEWPAELAFVVDTSETMAHSPRLGESVRSRLAEREIRNIVGRLPQHTDVRLLHYAGTGCSGTVQHGPYTPEQREIVLERLGSLDNGGPAPLAASLRAAADALDGQNREALIMAFVGSDDTCGQDICTTIQSIVERQPKIRFSLVDMSGTAAVGNCVADTPGGAYYFWGDVAPGEAVDLSSQVRDELSR